MHQIFALCPIHIFDTPLSDAVTQQKSQKPHPLPIPVTHSKHNVYLIPYFHSTIFCIKVLYNLKRVYHGRSYFFWNDFYHVTCTCPIVQKQQTQLFQCSFEWFRAVERIHWLLWLYQHISLLKHDFNYTDHETWISLTFSLLYKVKTMLSPY